MCNMPCTTCHAASSILSLNSFIHLVFTAVMSCRGLHEAVSNDGFQFPLTVRVVMAGRCQYSRQWQLKTLFRLSRGSIPLGGLPFSCNLCKLSWLLIVVDIISNAGFLIRIAPHLLSRQCTGLTLLFITVFKMWMSRHASSSSCQKVEAKKYCLTLSKSLYKSGRL